MPHKDEAGNCERQYAKDREDRDGRPTRSVSVADAPTIGAAGLRDKGWDAEVALLRPAQGRNRPSPSRFTGGL